MRLNEEGPQIVTADWTSSEKQLLEAVRWIRLDELPPLAQRETIYPNCLPDLAKQWLSGWDGRLETVYD